MMTEQNKIALATCVNGTPNVRIVNFFYDTQKKGILYFSTFRNNPKVKEFQQNQNVAFTTVPTGSNEHVRVTKGTVQKSDLSIFDLKDDFIQKIPDYEMTIQQVGKKLDLYEIHFKKASVTIDFNQFGRVTL